MDLEFYEPAEAAALMRCTESWLREGAASGRFPHLTWGKGKIIFTSEHIAEIARIQEVPIQSHPKERLIGTRARRR